jgi:hypothetical protein
MNVPASTIKDLYDSLASALFAASMTEGDITRLQSTYDKRWIRGTATCSRRFPLRDTSKTQLKSIVALFFTKVGGTLDPLSRDFSSVESCPV